MAEWLCRGLQILVQRFDSASGLHHRKKLKDPAIPPRAAYLPRYAIWKIQWPARNTPPYATAEPIATRIQYVASIDASQGAALFD